MKGKKFFVGLLSAVLAFGSVSIAAYAADDETAQSNIKIGDTTYETLSDALAEAQKLNSATVDMNDSTVTLSQELHISKSVTITNGTIDISNQVMHGNGFIYVTDGADLTLDGVTVKGEDYSSAFGVIYAQNGTVTLENCTFTLKKETAESNADKAWGLENGGVLKGSDDPDKSKFVINGGTYTLTDTVRAITGAAVDISNATITATHTETSSEHFFRNVFGTIKNSTITASNFQNGIKNTQAKKLELSEDTKLTFTDMKEYGVQLSNGATITEDTSSSVTADSTKIELTADNDTIFGAKSVTNLGDVTEEEATYKQLALFSGIDSLDYSAVGFEFTINNKKPIMHGETKTVYDKLTIGDEAFEKGNFATESQYVYGLTVKLDKADFSELNTLEFRPFTDTADGKTIFGAWQSISFNAN